MPYADAHNGRIFVETVWNEKELIRQVPGSAWDPDLKKWSIPQTWPACLQLRAIFGANLKLGPNLVKWAAVERATRITESLELRTVLEPTERKLPKLYGFQEAAVRFLNVAWSTLLADEMGTGKTVQTLAALDDVHRLGLSTFPVLIICPKSVTHSWRDHTETWLPDATPFVIEGTATQRTKIFKAAAACERAVIIVNFEQTWRLSRIAGYPSLRMKRCKVCDRYGDDRLKPAQCEVHPKELNAFNFKVVVVDEAHRVKNPTAKQTRAVWALGDAAERRLALTGTPVANDPSDLWSIMRFVAPLEHPVKGKFVDRYCLQAWNMHGGLDIVGINPEHMTEFHNVINPRMRRVTKAEVLPQLPPKVHVRRDVEMTPKQAKAYANMEEGLVTRLESGELMWARNDAIGSLRLLQFSSAYMEPTGTLNELGNPEYRMIDPSPKVDALVDVLEDLDGSKPVVVAAMHRQLIDLACTRLAKLKIPYARITGAENQAERQYALKRLNANEIRVLLFTMAAGGTGLTMTAADTIVFLQRDWSMVNNMQAEDRVHRIGSERHQQITVIDLITAGTVEEQQIAALYAKKERLREITQDRARLTAAGLGTGHMDAEYDKIMTSNVI